MPSLNANKSWEYLYNVKRQPYFNRRSGRSRFRRVSMHKLAPAHLHTYTPVISTAGTGPTDLNIPLRRAHSRSSFAFWISIRPYPAVQVKQSTHPGPLITTFENNNAVFHRSGEKKKQSLAHTARQPLLSLSPPTRSRINNTA